MNTAAGRKSRRFVLRYRGPGKAPISEVARIEESLRVVDRTPRMVLVEGSSAGISRVLAALPRWDAAEEAIVPVPSTGPRVRRPA